MAVFKCHVCGFQDASIRSVVFHQRLHINEKNFLFRCPHPLCITATKTSQGLELHVKEFHLNVQHSCASTSTDETVRSFTFACHVSTCSERFCTTRDLCHHYLDHHIKNKGDSVQCPLVNRCSSSSVFKNRANLASHLSVKHVGWRSNAESATQVPSSSGGQQGTTTHTDSDDNFDPGSTMDYEEEDPTHQDGKSFADLFFTHIAKFYLMLEAELVLPESTVQSISENLQLFSELIQYQVKQALQQVLTDPDIGLASDKVIKVMNHVCLSDAFYAAHHKESPGPTFTSQYFRDQYMSRNLSYVAPERVSLDHDRIDGASVYLVKPSNTLKLLLKDTSVQNQILESFGYKSTPGLYQDYKDGSVCKSRSSYSEERIDLIFASDACNVTSHMKGAAQNKHKVNCTYFLTGNLKPHLRAKLDSIHLALIFKDKLLQDQENYGVKKCYKPLLDDVKELESHGIEFMGRTIKVACQFFVCDSLGAHQLGGFTGSFSAKYFCRFCEVTRDVFKNCPTTLCNFRTREEYHASIAALRIIQRRKPDVVTYKGVKENSYLNSLSEFHVVDPSLPPCLAHDLFEGVLDWDLTAIISGLADAGWFTHLSLNHLITYFKCVGSDVANKPSDAVSATKLNGHAVQNWTLVRLLTFILEGKIKEPQNEYWQLYLLLKRVVEYACSPSFNNQDLKDFKELLNEYMRQRTELLTSEIKPKHHYLMHYPDLIPLVGPLIHLFTLRFEAKHQFLKRVSKACKNFINLYYTLSHRHQVYLSYLRTGVIYPEGIGPTKICYKNPSEYEGSVKDIIKHLGKIDKYYGSLESDGQIFRTGSYIILDGRKKVGCIKVMASVGSQVYLIIEEFQPVLWKEYGIYRIQPLGMIAVTISSLTCILQGVNSRICQRSGACRGHLGEYFDIGHLGSETNPLGARGG